MIAPESPAASERLERTPRWRRVVGDLLWGLSALFWLALVGTLWVQPDACAAITVFPVWAWLVPGLTLSLTAWGVRRQGRRGVAIVAFLAWCLFVLAFAEEPGSLMRSLTATSSENAWREARRAGRAVRVVSLNCAIGNPNAAREVARYRPDIVLLQESLNRAVVEALARELFGEEGSVVPGPDASLLVRGKVVAAPLPPNLRAYFVQARVQLASGLAVEVMSTRLVPAVFRLDVGSPDCWREQAANRRQRREQVATLVRRLEAIPASIPIILGGDLNAPQRDAAFRPFSPRLYDTFREAGRGWGNTIINDFPFLRIDQVWASRSLRTRKVIVAKTRYSDHRMVICDLELLQP
ncbi:Metal-dependent hydrolase, endonuclease/exonuclease/phosphatase family [Singulisphaera sp. GP187]|uniref:endonuclease/exonuclease/phosphatase family protein n=1 Tax=Singulisphaera sp. GP187 TaxID=1882752 RepID=UPI0009266E4F|nr:endonuclease/exonuclease/phosphatase family protein [Singulisphaera sp. GP187]SIO58076.1 Metal-dependent hydrolase, endonuclease/exonuclease/phosphatase family [Singulisphaera sp. GP187]